MPKAQDVDVVAVVAEYHKNKADVSLLLVDGTQRQADDIHRSMVSANCTNLFVMSGVPPSGLLGFTKYQMLALFKTVLPSLTDAELMSVELRRV